MKRAVAGVVLAGGWGRRYGMPKAGASLPDGRTFLAACADALRRAGVRIVVATVPPAFDGPVPKRTIAVEISSAERDQLASLRRGAAVALAAGPWDRLVVHPVDHPLVRPATIRRLLEVEAQAVIPRHAGRGGHPVVIGRGVACGLVDGSQPGPTLREVLARAGAASVEVDDPGVITNCNSPEALRKGLAKAGPE
jgi:molybdenum cofactor cytidylyltransferase